LGGRETRSLRHFLSLREGSIFIVTVAISILFVVFYPLFGSLASFYVIATTAAPLIIIGTGQTFLLTVGELDLSVGAVFALAPCLTLVLYGAGIPLPACMVIAILAAAVVGYANGLISVKLRVPSLLTTLGMFFLATGASLLITNFETITAPFTTVTISSFETAMGGGTVGYVPTTLIWGIAIAAVFAVIFLYTKHGLWTVATGSNINASLEVGVNTTRTKILNFIMTASLAGFAGILETMRTETAYALQGGFPLTLQTIIVAVIGGTALAGGSGTVIGTMIGAVFLGVLYDGFAIGGFGDNEFRLTLGLVLVTAVAINLRVQTIRSLGRTGRERGK
jgi:simple sugar transport system permease protein